MVIPFQEMSMRVTISLSQINQMRKCLLRADDVAIQAHSRQTTIVTFEKCTLRDNSHAQNALRRSLVLDT